MYIRCLDCQSSTWIENLETGSAAQSVTCDSCGRAYSLAVPDELGETQREHYQSALGFAEENEIDLPSAYSVLLGIMTLDEARGLHERDTSPAAEAATASKKAGESEPPAEPATPAIQPPSVAKEIPRRKLRHNQFDDGELPYDPAFRRAVRDGCLTAKQAMERGNRKLMANRLARAHRLPARLAYEVTDNRIRLTEALQRRGRLKPVKDVRPRRAITKKQQTMIAAAASVMVLIVLLNGIRLWESFSEEARGVQELTDVTSKRAALAAPAAAPATPQAIAQTAPPEPRTSVRTDENGRVLEVSGPNPSAVLIRFCESTSTNNRFQPVELTETVPPIPGSRLGLLRDFNDLSSLYVIRIRRDHRSRRWVAGDGRAPIQVRPAPDYPIDVARTPVTTH